MKKRKLNPKKMENTNIMHRIPTFLLSGLAFATLLYLSSCGEDNQPAVNSAPTFEEDTYAFQVAENVANGDEVGTVSATDENSDELTYSISGSQTEFDIDASTGAVTLATALDFETTASYSLELEASDGTDTAAADVTITITDVNDNTPAFAETAYSFEIAEDAAGSDEVGRVSATDADGTAMLTYSLSGEGAANFAISNTPVASGEEVPITVEANLASLTSPVTLTVTVDDGDNTVDVEVEIVITAGANMPPVFASTPYSFNVASEATDGAVVGTITATDAENDGLTYSLSGNGATNFAINSTAASGEAVPITVASGANLASLGSSVTILLTVSDGSNTVTVNVLITIIAGNVAPLFDQTTYPFEIASSATEGALVGKVAATDSNTGDLLTYLLSGDGATHFTIQNGTAVASGEEVSVVVAANADLASLGGAATLTVMVTDDATPALTATAELEITINAGNVAPVFDPTTYSFELASSATEGALVGMVSATDSNAGDLLTYTLSGTGAAHFTIQNGTAVASGEEVSVVVAANADLASLGGAATLTVTVTDDATPALTATATVEIAIVEGNVAPVFENTPYSFDIAENAASGDEVGKVSATDSNAGDLLTYTLSGEGAANFAITNGTDVASGEEVSVVVAATATLDHETMPSYMLEVQASDNATSALTAMAEVTVNVTNVPTAPVLTVSGTQTLTLNEGTTAGIMATGYTVSATDEDNDEVTFSVDDDRFAIADDGALNVLAAKVFDHETEPTLMLTITATDDSPGTLTDTETVDIAITDVAEPPVLTVSGTQTLALNEGTTAGIMATGFMVTATDEDNDGVTFSVDDDRFGIADDGALNVLAAKVFDHETEPTLMLTITATDNSPGTLTDTETVDIAITDVAEAPVLTISGTQATLNEGRVFRETATGYTFSATDEDGDGVTFSVDDTRFSIAADGMLNILPTILDFETEPTITLTITATDDSSEALATTQEVTIDVTDASFSVPVFASGNISRNLVPVFGDVDGDGDMDMLIGRTDGNLDFYRWGEADGTGTGWAAVTGTGNNPFHVNDADTNSEPFDVGGGPAPAFGDVDGDGDMDVLVGEVIDTRTLSFFRRGTATDGADADSGKSWSNQTAALTGNLVALGTHSTSFSSPAFGDVDNDGDMDVLVGANVGNLDFYRWGAADGTGTGWMAVTGTGNNPFHVDDATMDNETFDVGSFASPTFFDVDGDGDLDVLVGAGDGKLHFFRLGTASNSAASPGSGWSRQTGSVNPFDAPQDDSPFDFGAGSDPAFGDVDNDGDLDLVVGDTESSTLNIWYWNDATDVWQTTSDL